MLSPKTNANLLCQVGRSTRSSPLVERAVRSTQCNPQDTSLRCPSASATCIRHLHRRLFGLFCRGATFHPALATPAAAGGGDVDAFFGHVLEQQVDGSDAGGEEGEGDEDGEHGEGAVAGRGFTIPLPRCLNLWSDQQNGAPGSAVFQRKKSTPAEPPSAVPAGKPISPHRRSSGRRSSRRGRGIRPARRRRTGRPTGVRCRAAGKPGWGCFG